MFYNSTISAKPLMSPTQTQSVLNGFGNQSAGPNPFGSMPGLQLGSNASPIVAAMNSAMHANNQRNSLAFQRMYAPLNAQHLLNAEQSRANSGLGGFGYLLGRQGQGQYEDQSLQNAILQQLMQYAG